MEWYWCVDLNNVISILLLLFLNFLVKVVYEKVCVEYYKDYVLKNIDFVIWGFSFVNWVEIVWCMFWYGEDKDCDF